MEPIQWRWQGQLPSTFLYHRPLRLSHVVSGFPTHSTTLPPSLPTKLPLGFPTSGFVAGLGAAFASLARLLPQGDTTMSAKRSLHFPRDTWATGSLDAGSPP